MDYQNYVFSYYFVKPKQKPVTSICFEGRHMYHFNFRNFVFNFPQKENYCRESQCSMKTGREFLNKKFH